jgi:hypothetical protein
MKLSQLLSFERLLTVLVLFICFATSAVAREGNILKEVGDDIVAIYSDVCWHEEAGELVGKRILIMSTSGDYFVGDYFVFFQGPEGDAMPPHVTEATIEKGKINFSYPASDDSGKSRMVTFSGKITPLMITGSLSYGPAGTYEKETLRLKRQLNKKIPTQACK